MLNDEQAFPTITVENIDFAKIYFIIRKSLNRTRSLVEKFICARESDVQTESTDRRRT